MASAVRQRTSEIGLRIALGAEPSGSVKFVIVQGLAIGAVGIGIGLVAFCRTHAGHDGYARGHSTDGSHDIRGYECLIFPGDRDGLLGARAPSGWHRSDGGAAGRVACEGRVWMVYETRGLHSNFDLFRFTSHLNRLKV